MTRGKKSIVLLLVVSALVVAGILAGVRLWHVHLQTSDWTLWPREVPSKVQFADREYNCGPDAKPAQRDLSELTPQGRTAGGAEIYAQPPRAEARVYIVVRTSEGTFPCPLMGGP
ncbi:hypothetical protein F8G81_20985 [Arthrobacter sp. CDRTa11]|nr:hypothetical protein F8G81_20985 [Arthrobacter sp. CDRTa11]